MDAGNLLLIYSEYLEGVVSAHPILCKIILCPRWVLFVTLWYASIHRYERPTAFLGVKRRIFLWLHVLDMYGVCEVVSSVQPL